MNSDSAGGIFEPLMYVWMYEPTLYSCTSVIKD